MNGANARRTKVEKKNSAFLNLRLKNFIFIKGELNLDIELLVVLTGLIVNY